MVKVKRTLTFDHPLDEAISLLAAANKQSYSGYVVSRLLINENIQKTIQELEKMPKFPEISLEKIQKKKPLAQ